MAHSKNKLTEAVLALSRASNFEEARREWYHDGRITTDRDRCPCTVHIKQRCYISNLLTNETLYVGNDCINIYFKMRPVHDQVFAGLHYLEKSVKNCPTKQLVEHARAFGWISDSEATPLRCFSSATERLLPIPTEKLLELNQRIVDRATAPKRAVAAIVAGVKSEPPPDAKQQLANILRS